MEGFINKINQYAKIHLTEEISKKIVEFDSVLSHCDINGYTIDELAKLKPYGQGFKKPIFGYRMDVSPRGFREDVSGNTLILTDVYSIKVVGFRNKDLYIDLGKPEKIAILGCPSVNVYNGNVSYQFMIHEQNLRVYKK